VTGERRREDPTEGVGPLSYWRDHVEWDSLELWSGCFGH
jgi:hypothetical protein